MVSWGVWFSSSGAYGFTYGQASGFYGFYVWRMAVLWLPVVSYGFMVSYGFFMVSAYISPQILVWVALTCGRLAALAWLAAPGQACMVGLAVVVLR